MRMHTPLRGGAAFGGSSPWGGLPAARRSVWGESLPLSMTAPRADVPTASSVETLCYLDYVTFGPPRRIFPAGGRPARRHSNFLGIRSSSAFEVALVLLLYCTQKLASNAVADNRWAESRLAARHAH